MDESKEKESQEQNNPQPHYDSTGATINFSDVISVNVRNDYVHLGIGIRDLDDPNKVTVNHKVYMTLDHFLRFADLCNDISEDIKQKIEDSHENDSE